MQGDRNYFDYFAINFAELRGFSITNRGKNMMSIEFILLKITAHF